MACVAATIIEIIASLRNQTHITSVVVSHDRDLSMTIADRVALMLEGKIHLVDTPANFQKSTDPRVTEFLNPKIDLANPRYNLELVRNIKDQQEQDQQTQGDDQQSTENPGGEGEQSESDSQQNQEGSEGSSESQQQANDGDPSQREDEMTEEDLKALQEELERAAEEAENSEQPEQLSEAELAALRQQQEQQQAMEQWLRRIPDDPGGLLRRKFRYQYQRYGKDQEGKDVWPDDEVQPW